MKLKTGIDIYFEKEIFKEGNIGLLCNHTSRLSNGILVADEIINRGGGLKALFSPEHGLYGVQQDGEKTEDSTYRGISAYSLYGENRRASKEQLKDLDYILIDLQEIGCRFYTYLYTLAYMMEVAAEIGLKVIVTDRPAPLGRNIEGNRISEEYSSFVGSYGLPIRTGLTIGEFALYLKQNYIHQCDLEVIKLEGWNSQVMDLNRSWLNPSPNIPSLKAALVYTGTCLFEGTNISEGRGTTRPFETIGAPGLDGFKLSQVLNSYNLPGVSFIYTKFKPEFGKHKNSICEGVQVNITDIEMFKSLKVGVAIIGTIFSLFRNKVEILQSNSKNELCFIDKLTGTVDFRKKLDKGSNWLELYSLLSDNEEEFTKLRDNALLY